MTYEYACGAVVFTHVNGELKYLITRNLKGIYGFPKGHVEANETEEETALREVYEETRVRIRLIDGFRTTDERPVTYRQDTMKRITYFLGSFENQEIVYQQEELTGAWLLSYAEAMERFQFESSKRILKEANDFVSSMGR